MKNQHLGTWIIVLGGALKKTKTGWHTTNFQEKGDLFGVSGDRLRILASAELYKSFRKNNIDQNIYFIASGGKGQYKNMNVPCLSQVLKKELVEIGIPAGAIIEESKSNNTFKQLHHAANILKKKNIKKIILISNKHHLPRVRVFIEYDKNLKAIFKDIKLKSAESILMRANPKKWKDYLDRVFKSNDMKKRVLLERRGIAQIKNGTYNFTIGPKKLICQNS